MSSFSEDYSGVSEKEISVDNDDENETHAIEFYSFNRNNDKAKTKDPYKNQRLYSECDENQDLETVDEQDHEDEI